jgi:hypothetical protein
MKTKFYLLLLLIFNLVLLEVKAQPSYYAPVPYYTGFENNAIDSNWYTSSSLPGGRIQVWSNSSFAAATTPNGNYWLGMDIAPPAGTYILNDAWLGLNALGASNLHLRFWWSEWNDETEPQDGIYLSDDGGTTFTKVIDLNGGDFTDLTWRSYDFNLDSMNTAHGLSYTANYVIKFSQYDNYYFSGGNDGFLFDEISIDQPTSITKIAAEKIFLYPNPVTSKLHVNFGKTLDFASIKIKNLLGETVAEHEYKNCSTATITLDAEAGIYFVELSSREGVQLIKFSKQ